MPYITLLAQDQTLAMHVCIHENELTWCEADRTAGSFQCDGHRTVYLRALNLLALGNGCLMGEAISADSESK